MNRTIKDATVKRYFYDTHDQLRAHLQNFVDAYNFARRLKTLRGLTPIRIHLQSLDLGATQIQNKSAPANAGTKQLAALHPAYPIKCRTSTQRTQAPESVDIRKQLPP
jgi:hypothetical protein